MIFRLTILFVFIICTNNCIFGISDNMKFVIDTIGIPRYNVYGNEINEDIYYAYNVFTYGDPSIVATNRSQRFGSVPTKGKWTRYNGLYRGYGERGEYYLLGQSYSGSVISNVYFPVDSFPETTPDKFRYIDTPLAYESWLDKTKYRYIDQIEYMKSTNLLFDELDFSTRKTNPYNLVSYNFSVNTYGMSKFTLDTCSTWKTNGIVTARFLNSSNKVRYAIYATAPIAAGASIQSELKVGSNYQIETNEDEIVIPIEISASAVNLSNYAKAEHIKEIVSILYVDNVEIARISGSKTVKVDRNIFFTVSRKKYPFSDKNYPIVMKVKSYLYTEFSVDGLIQSEVVKEVSLKVKEKEVNPIKSINISALEKENDVLVIRPLIQTKNTEGKSIGISEKGRYLAIRIEKDGLISYDLYINNKIITYDKILDNDKYLVIKILLNGDMISTIESWNSLREKEKNYFNVNFDQVGNRMKSPNVIKILANGSKEYLEYFDLIDDYNQNINYIFNNNVLNKDNLNIKTRIDDWIKI